MAYESTHLTKLSALQALAQKAEAAYAKKTDLASLQEQVEGITVPTKVSELTNDSNYQTGTQVAASIAAAEHASIEVVTTVPTTSNAQSNVLYLYKNTQTGYYDIYALVGGKIEWLDDVSVDLSNYSTTSEVQSLISAAAYSHPTYTAHSSGLYKVTVDEMGHVSAATAVAKSDITALGIPSSDTTYSVATTSANGLMSSSDKSKLDGIEIATDDEVTEMLNEIYGL